MLLSNGAITVTSTYPQEIENYKKNGYYEVNEEGVRKIADSKEYAEKIENLEREINALGSEKETLKTEKEALENQVATLTAELKELKKANKL